jgi:hypothetical protein
LELLRSVGHEGWKSMVVSDEVWFHFSNRHEQIWPSDCGNPAITEGQTISSLKKTLTAMSNPYGFHFVIVLLKGQM